MRCREDLFPGADKVELFLSDLAVNGHVAASTQNQAFGDIERRTSSIERRTPNIERMKLDYDLEEWLLEYSAWIIRLVERLPRHASRQPH
jgi:hypothetical protein